jgi:hypothetical protein
MPIDRIGRAPPATSPTGGADGAKRASDAPRAFEAPRADPAAAPSAATSPLARLQTGELDLPRYLDAHIDAATCPLEGLESEDLGAIREHLRSASASDPALVDLVRQATGQTPEEKT